MQDLQPINLPQLKNQPLVSVLIPNYNYADYIGIALESVLRQSYSNFEVIICDDGSTDGSCELVNTYMMKDSRIQLICKQNGGPASAWNAAYKESKGHIICLLDADDVWLPNKLEKVIEAFRSKQDCGLVTHNVIHIDGRGKLLKTTPMFSKLASGWLAPFSLQNGGFVDDIPPTSALSFRREIAELLLPMNETFLRNVDAVIRNLASFLTVVIPIPEVLSQYRIHGSNIMATSSLTADFLEREIARSELIYQEVKRFLDKTYGVELTKKLTSINHRLVYCHNFYLLARLKGLPKSEWREAHYRLVIHPEFCWSGLEGWFLKWGNYLPNILFKVLFQQVYGSGWIKRFIQLLRKQKMTT